MRMGVNSRKLFEIVGPCIDKAMRASMRRVEHIALSPVKRAKEKQRKHSRKL